MNDSRLSRLQSLLTEQRVDAVFVSSLANIVYLTNFSHFTDIEREAFVLITKKDKYIFTDARYSHAVKTQVKDFQFRELSAQQLLTEHLKDIFEKETIALLGIEENNLTVREDKQLKKVMKKRKHVDIHSLRLFKDAEEIKKIKKACEIGDKAFASLLKHIKLGVTEKELASLLEANMRKSGCEPSFPTIVAFQENAAIPHHKTGNRKLKKNEFILIDSGVKYEEYCSDMTRTVFFGKPNEEQKRAYETVLKSQQLAIDLLNNKLVYYTKTRKRVMASDVDKVARDYILSRGYPSIPHSLGHGIGLQVHEAPSLSPKSESKLEEGMVFSIEPGIYLNDKFGIRIEDIFAIQKGKLVQLTKSLSNLIELPSH